MHVDSKTKLVLLPETGNYQLVRIPIARNIAQEKSMLIKDGKVYELNQIEGKRDEKSPKLNDGSPVKSFIFESTSDDPGFVIQNSSMLVGSQYNVAYLLLAIMYNNEEIFTKRFITLEDIIDQLASLYSTEGWVTLISNEVYTTALEKICEYITANDELFYKFSVAKGVEFLSTKITALENYFKVKKDEVSLYKLMKQDLLDPTIENVIPTNVLDQMALKHAVDFVCDSYANPQLKAKVIETNKYDFTVLEDHVRKVRDHKRDLRVVQDNMNLVVKTTSENKKKKVVEKKTVKKTVKKVAVGKGALDGFFKKA